MVRKEPGLEFLPGLFLVRPLGRGGMGEAWVARDLGRDEELVAKILPADAPEDRVALLRREARLVRKLEHPRIVPVYGFLQGPNGSAVLLRYMRGGDASSLRGASAKDVVRLARDVADALAYLHGQGVVHRDVKASNVLLDADGRAYLADFGIAAVAGPAEGEAVVLGGGSRGSMSPQQERGEPAEPADDVYALGALLHELRSGRPWTTPSGAEAPSLDPAVGPPGLRELVGAMLAREAEDRPGTAAVLRSLQEVDRQLHAAAESDRAPVRLQPPPRVRDIAVFPSRPDADRPAGSDRASRGSPPLHALLLAGLALAAAFVVLVLPRLVATHRESAPAAPGSSLPAEAPPAPAERPPTTVAPPPEAAPPPSPPVVARTAPPARVDPGESAGAPAERRPAPAGDAAPDPSSAEFERAMSAAQAALDAGDPGAARAALEQAEFLRPGDSAVADARKRLDDALRAKALERHREAALALEAREDWKGAVGEYEAALKVDPTVAFALYGRARARKRARLTEQLEFHASHPDRLSSEAVAREAEGVLADAREIEPPGPRLRGQVAALERALARARMVVRVELQSDGVTQIVVHRYGTLGAFKEKSLELRPGTYVVVGTRRGFRDVRRTLVVDPDAPRTPLVVRCEESI